MSCSQAFHSACRRFRVRKARAFVFLLLLSCQLCGQAFALEASLRVEDYSDVLTVSFANGDSAYSVRRTGPQQLTVLFEEGQEAPLGAKPKLDKASLISDIQPLPDGFTLHLRTKAFGFVTARVAGQARLKIHVFSDAIGARWVAPAKASALPVAPKAAGAVQAAAPVAPKAAEAVQGAIPVASPVRQSRQKAPEPPAQDKAAAGRTGVYVAPKILWGHQFSQSVSVTTNAGGSPQAYGAAQSAGSAWGGALALGYDFYPKYSRHFRLELEYAKRLQSKTRTRVEVNTLTNETVELWRSLDVSTLFLNLFYDIPTSWGGYVYVGGGAGRASIDVKDAMTDSVFGVISSGQANRSTFAWNLAAGISHPLDDHWSLDAGYRFCDFGLVYGLPGTDGIGSSYQAKSGVLAHELLFGLRYSH
jgi:opacity protein-like surface antigen